MNPSQTTIILIPGFGEYVETPTFKDLKVELEGQGYSVIIPAWPHYPDDLDKYSMTETLHSLREQIKELQAQGKQLILHGNSMGGILAILLAKEFSPLKLSLTVTPYQAGTDDDLAGKYKDWKESGFREFTSSRYGTLKIPFSFIEDARQYNALDHIADIKCPILFIAGEKDTNVPWTTVKKLHDKATEPKEWHVIEGAEHRFQHQEEKLKEVNEIIVDFISQTGNLKSMRFPILLSG
ncbi:alpha/beta fold hydrolase [bacterium]|nr:alpha/beta fold hydrolase [bacterium]